MMKSANREMEKTNRGYCLLTFIIEVSGNTT